MGNRSKYATAAALLGAGGAVAARRRARLRRAAKGIHDAILATPDQAGLTPATPVDDDSHAPGHRHLPPPQSGTGTPRPLRGRRGPSIITSTARRR